MIVTCENCGKRYNLDVSKIEYSDFRTKCKNCGEMMIISKTPSDTYEPEPPPDDFGSLETAEDKDSTSSQKTWKKAVRYSLRSKMVVLFVITPIVLMALASLFTLNRMNDLSGRITEESTAIVTKMAQAIIAEKGRAVATAVKLYLETHPNLKREDFQNDPEFKKLSVLKVGETGYTVVINTTTKGEPCRIWAHPNKDLIGAEIIAMVTAKQGPEAGRTFGNILTTAFQTNKESQGYYTFLDGEKYMVVVPVEGTDFFVPSTTYIPEFTLPMNKMKEWAKKTTGTTLTFVVLIIALATLLIGFIAILYGNRLSRAIENLTDMAEKISVGNLNTEINIASKDELGVLGEAIARMQESIRISIERIQTRKGDSA